MRKFTDEELTQDQVVTLLKAALMSPSSKRSNPWQFVVVDDKETLKHTVLSVLSDNCIKNNISKMQGLMSKAPGNQGGANIIVGH